MATPIFKAPARVFNNNNKEEGSRAPDSKVLVDFTPENAMAFAQWLMASADQCQVEGKTIRKYDRDGNYEELPGFAIAIGLWQEVDAQGYTKLKGNLAPLPVEGGPAPVAQPAAAGGGWG